jgi:hypothetical protein
MPTTDARNDQRPPADAPARSDAFWEFGGWGRRVDVAGRVGLVTRKGPTVRIRRGDASEVLITVDDAGTAAALLNTLADVRPAAGSGTAPA